MDGAIHVAAPADAPMSHRFSSAAGEHVLIVPFSRVFDLPAETALALDGDAVLARDWIARLGAETSGEVPLDHFTAPAPQSISLNVSSSCNLGCRYCYAAQGSFGGAQPTPMSWVTAQAAIDKLISGAERSAPVTICFLGGEPFVNAPLIHRSVAYATELARSLQFDVRFSVTTNATLLEPNDIELLQQHAFAVSVSIDGDESTHDAERMRLRDGRGSWRTTTERIRPLLAAPGRSRVCARATVTRRNLDLADRLRALAELGFQEVGFAPLRGSPDGHSVLGAEDWPRYLESLIYVARAELARASRNLPVRLSNLAIALKQIHRGASSPYPCGAGGGYFSVAADGRWYACHRAIGDSRYLLGTNTELDAAVRDRFLTQRHVHSQTECRSCWARYLCSGGCHQEASARSVESCDFVRAWLDFCLRAYCELGSARVVEEQAHAY